MNPRFRMQQGIWMIVLVASLVLWNLPFADFIALPFKLLATWLHEVSHGLVMLLSGAALDRVEIFPDTSGLAFADYSLSGPGDSFIAAAGYMGTPLFGAVFLFSAASPLWTRAALFSLGALMGIFAVFYMGNDYGVWVSTVGAVLFMASALVLPKIWQFGILNVVGIQACMNSVLDIRILFKSQQVVDGRRLFTSDATRMADASFGNATLWAVLWLLWSFLLLFAVFRYYALTQGRNASQDSLV